VRRKPANWGLSSLSRCAPTKSRRSSIVFSARGAASHLDNDARSGLTGRCALAHCLGVSALRQSRAPRASAPRTERPLRRTHRRRCVCSPPNRRPREVPLVDDGGDVGAPYIRAPPGVCIAPGAIAACGAEQCIRSSYGEGRSRILDSRRLTRHFLCQLNSRPPVTFPDLRHARRTGCAL
jgi:hypothetical protein